MDVAIYSIEVFVSATGDKVRNEGQFELESERLLQINLNGTVWTKMGSMVAYRGQIKFVREGVFEHGLGKMLKRAVSGEGTRLTKAEGRGGVELADQSKRGRIIERECQTIRVNG